MSSAFVPQPGDDVPTIKKYSVDVSLQGFVGSLTDRAAQVAQAIQNQQAGGNLDPTLAAHLQKVADLSQQLQAELDAIKAIDPDAFSKLKSA